MYKKNNEAVAAAAAAAVAVAAHTKASFNRQYETRFVSRCA